jgi:hypothetical protein
MNQDFRDLLHELSEENARFLVVGAFALAAHGIPRATGDIDVWVEPTPANAERVYAALVAFGAPLDKLTVEDLTETDVVFQMGLPPRRIDILTSIDGVEFEKAWANRKLADFGGIEVSVIGAEDFVTNKRASGRAKDLVDADSIEALLGES